MQSVGEKLTDDEVDEMMQEADMDGNGEIDYDEFVKVISIRSTSTRFAVSLASSSLSTDDAVEVIVFEYSFVLPRPVYASDMSKTK